MRLTEALVKPMFARAIATKRVNALNAAFKQHLGLDDIFAQVQSENSPGKLWKPISFKAGNGTRPIKAPVTRKACAHPLIVYLLYGSCRWL